LPLGASFDHDSLYQVYSERARRLPPQIFMATSTLMAEIVFELRFAFVQCLQTQLPAVQLNRELIDVTGDFGALRFVFFQLSPKLVRVSDRACVWFCRLRNSCLLSAFLTGQVHARGGPVRDQRGLAVLAMKENVRISGDFAHRIHAALTSRMSAAVARLFAASKLG